MNREANKFVRDPHGHVYIYVPEHHLELVGSTLQFCEAPTKGLELSPTKTQAKKDDKLSTLKAIRAHATAVGLVIPDLTSAEDAQAMLTQFLVTAGT